ncbi:MAG: hypothetical protein CMG69_00405 [Candidatus Marinimicrobia bacterium]|nr:hypothetical protein [Candidatus Neomarinimicrobiota bacterium]|tara:strand:- start:41954 stop:43564 length:1611 start_codon:yes stop_codon:yes gene_type:complete
MKNMYVARVIIYFIGFQWFLFSQNPGDIHFSEFIEMRSADEIIQELESGFSEYDLPLDIEYGVSLYRIEYHTVDPHALPTIASGVLAVPLAQANPLPFFSFQHGTVLKRTSVASVQGFDVVSMWLGGRGFITAIPDFLGLGVSEMLHPYMVYISSATAVVDMIRAGRNLCDSLGIAFSGQTFLSGYSEGGYVTMAAHKYIETELAGEILITASAPCAGPYDLSAVMLELMLTSEPYNAPFYLPYTIFAYDAVYDLYDFPSEFFVSPYDTLLPPLFDGDHSGSEVDEVMPEIPINIVLPEVIEAVSTNMNHPLRVALEENDVYLWAPQSPVALLHSTQDELVPVENTLNAYEYFINNGAENVEMYVDDLGGHGDAAGVLLLAAAAWIEEFVVSSHYFSYDYGWNMIGIPLIPENNSVEFLFPEAIENSLFSYDSGEYIEQTQLSSGKGYWLRFNDEDTTHISGDVFNEIIISVNEGWNLISGISTEINIDSLNSELIVSGSIFGFQGEYFEPQYIEPGKGYWLRCISDGHINFSVIH